MLKRVVFIDNFVGVGNLRVENRPELINADINTLELTDCGKFHIAFTDKGTFRRPTSYAECSPYGWEQCIEVAIALLDGRVSYDFYAFGVHCFGELMTIEHIFDKDQAEAAFMEEFANLQHKAIVFFWPTVEVHNELP